jgi:oxygen-dependent protoporphyrinogen oxidase
MAEYNRIAVIGGGAAGCSAAWHLHQAEYDVELFEKDEVLGGRTQTWRDNELAINTGAGFFTNFYPLLWELIAETGLSRHIVSNDKETVLCDTQQRYSYQISSVASFFRIPWLNLREKLRLIRITVGLLIRKTQLDLNDPQRLAQFDNESIANFARRKMGDNVYDYLIRPAIEPYWYFSCEDASAAMLMALQAEAPGAQFYTLRGGMDKLVAQLTTDFPSHLGQSIAAIKKTPDGQFRLETDSGTHETLFDGIIIATQAHHARQLVDSIPEFTTNQRSYLASQQYAANINVWFRIGTLNIGNCGFQMSPVGPERHGVAAWTDLGSVNRDDLAQDDRIAGVYLLDELSRRLMDEPDEVVAEQAWRAIRHFHSQLPAQHPDIVKIVRRRNAIPIPQVGRYKLAATFQQNQRPPVVFAGDYLATATIEGALQTGRIAASQFGL